MAYRIVAIADTHCHRWEEVHPAMREALAQADLAVHCGDYTGPAVAEGFQAAARRTVAVHGNSDPVELRRRLPAVEVLEVEGLRLGVTHPAWGGPPFPLEDLLEDFQGELDLLLFGHLHEPLVERLGKTLVVNPGQGYASFMVPATMAVVTLGPQVEAQVVTVVPPQ